MFRDVNEIIDSVASNTKGHIVPNKVLFDPALYNLIAETLFVDANGNAKTQTVLEMVKANHPEIEEFVKVYELAGSGTIIAGNFDSEYARLEVPKRAAQEPVQRKNLAFLIPVWGRVVARQFHLACMNIKPDFPSILKSEAFGGKNSFCICSGNV